MHISVDSTGSPMHLEFELETVDGKCLYRTYQILHESLMRRCQGVPCATRTGAAQVLDAPRPC